MSLGLTSQRITQSVIAHPTIESWNSQKDSAKLVPLLYDKVKGAPVRIRPVELAGGFSTSLGI